MNLIDTHHSFFNEYQCLTFIIGQTSLGNVVSTRKYPTPGTPGSNTDGPHSAGHGYYCMMFEYYITTQSVHENTETVKTKEILYTCDTYHLCDDRSLYEGYEVSTSCDVTVTVKYLNIHCCKHSKTQTKRYCP